MKSHTEYLFIFYVKLKEKLNKKEVGSMEQDLIPEPSRENPYSGKISKLSFC